MNSRRQFRSSRNSYNGKSYKNKSNFRTNYKSNRNNPKRFSSGQKNIGNFNPHNIINNSATQPGLIEENYIAKNNFSDFKINEMLKKNIIKQNYSTPTPIQDQSIPHILEGSDLIGIANTGTGKTAAFLIPLIDKVLNNRNKKVLIVAPTRELALQIQDELYKFTSGMNISSVLTIGGVSTFHQKRGLRQSFNFVIGTPGRIKDLVKNRNLQLVHFDSVVLDEADHMVDIGFIQDIKFIISQLPEKRQSLFFSATIDGKVKEIIAQFVTNPITISVKKKDTIDNINQEVIKTLSSNKKVDQLHDLLIKRGFDKVIIFGRTKWGVQKLSDELIQRGFRSAAIHGNKSQNQRQRTLKEFKMNEIDILLATDVAARGLDIDNVSHVINYDMPATYDDYIHRIGRTGRANKKGNALTFV